MEPDSARGDGSARGGVSRLAVLAVVMGVVVVVAVAAVLGMGMAENGF